VDVGRELQWEEQRAIWKNNKILCLEENRQKKIGSKFCRDDEADVTRKRRGHDKHVGPGRRVVEPQPLLGCPKGAGKNEDFRLLHRKPGNRKKSKTSRSGTNVGRVGTADKNLQTSPERNYTMRDNAKKTDISREQRERCKRHQLPSGVD